MTTAPEISALVPALLASPVNAIYGPSKSGKSLFLRDQVIPALVGAGHGVFVLHTGFHTAWHRTGYQSVEDQLLGLYTDHALASAAIDSALADPGDFPLVVIVDDEGVAVTVPIPRLDPADPLVQEARTENASRADLLLTLNRAVNAGAAYLYTVTHHRELALPWPDGVVQFTDRTRPAPALEQMRMSFAGRAAAAVAVLSQPFDEVTFAHVAASFDGAPIAAFRVSRTSNI